MLRNFPLPNFFSIYFDILFLSSLLLLRMGTCKKDNKTAIFETQYERKLLISSLLLIIIKKLILPSQKIIVLSINITSEKQ